MPTTVARLVSTTATSTGTQDFTTADLGGLTPKAALFIISFATAADADTTHASFGMGVAVSATSRYCVATAVEDGQGTQDAYRCGFNNACIAIINPSGTAATAYADFSSWLTDGVRINWVAAPSAARRIEIIFFAGTDLTVNNIGVVTINGSNGADKSLSGLTGSPNAAFFLTGRQGFTAATTSLTAGSPGRHVIGMAVKDTGEPNSTRQAGFYRRVDSGGSNENYRTNIWNNRVAGMDANGSRYWRLAVEGWPTNGITLFQRDHDGFDSDQIAVLPLQFAGSGQGVWCGVVDTKTSTGTQAYTNPGWKPDFLFTGGTYRSAIDVTTTLWGDQTAESETSGWGGTTATAAGFQSWRGVDGGGTSSTKSRSSTQSLDVIGGAGTVRYRATLSSFDTTGWTWNFSTADGTARKVLVFAHQGVGGGTQTLSPTGIATAEAFGSSTVTPGAVTLSPGGVASGEAFGTATVTPPPQSLSPSGVVSGEAFGDATVTPGAVTVSPDGVASGEAFGSPTLVAPGATQTLSPSGVTSGEAFGDATLSPGPVTISPEGIPSGEEFGVTVIGERNDDKGPRAKKPPGSKSPKGRGQE